MSLCAAGKDITIKFLIDNSGAMNERDIAEKTAAQLAVRLEDFLKNPILLRQDSPINMKILACSFWEKDGRIVTSDAEKNQLFDYRFGQIQGPDFRRLKKWSTKWFVARETTLGKLINWDWPAKNANTILVILSNSKKSVTSQDLLNINNEARKVNSYLYIASLPLGNERAYKEDAALDAELSRRVLDTFEWLKNSLNVVQFNMSVEMKINGEARSVAKTIVAQAPADIELKMICPPDANEPFWRYDGREISGDTLILRCDKKSSFEVQAVGVDSMHGKHAVTLKFEISAASSPSADFIAFPTSGQAPLTVTIENKSENGQKFQWNWGDGSQEVFDKDPGRHVYEEAGKYTITQNVLGLNGDSVKCSVIVEALSPAPKAAFSLKGASRGSVGEPVEFVNESKNASRYEWDFGDGSVVDAAQNPVHIFSKAGTYSVMLKAFNADGASSSQQISLDVAEKLEARFQWRNGQGGRNVTFVNESTGAVRYEWTFGDGSQVSTETAPSHTYGGTGSSYTVTLKAIAADGKQNVTSKNIALAKVEIESEEDSDEAESIVTAPVDEDDDEDFSEFEGEQIAPAEDEEGGAGILVLVLIVVVIAGGAIVAWKMLHGGKEFSVSLYSADRKLLGKKAVRLGQIVSMTELGCGNDLSFRIVKAEEDADEEYMVVFRKPDESRVVVQQKTIKLRLSSQWGTPVGFANLVVDSGRLEISEGTESEEEE